MIWVLTLVLFSSVPSLRAGQQEPDPYQKIQQRLQQGWNTWDSRSVLRHVRLPEGLAVNLSFKQQRWLDEPFLERALIGERGEGAPRVRPGLHAHDGQYSELEIEWQDLKARVRSCRRGDDLLLLIEPLKPTQDPVKLVVSLGMLWNRPGLLSRDGETLTARMGDKTVHIFVSGGREEDMYVPMQTPYLVLSLAKPVVVSSGRAYTVDQAEGLMTQARTAMLERSQGFAELGETMLAIESAIAWNTIFEARHQRVVSTVGRLWNEEYGGYCLFGWDNFFLAYLSALNHPDLALANIMEHLKSVTPGGFIPNDDRGNGSKSFDRSQPPVGAIMVKEVYKRVPQRWLLEAAYPVLLRWNRWWHEKRRNGDLLSYGSHKTDNPYHEPDVASRITAGYESGMDDSPMYEGVPFNADKGILELQDVGLTSLYIADCRALAEMAMLLGNKMEARALNRRGKVYAEALDRLWSVKDGYYLNRRSDTGELSPRRSPTLFYPLLSGKLPAERVHALMKHLTNPLEFGGEWVLPSISRDDPAFPKQRYWKGAIWPPLNFLTYLGLRQAGQRDLARDLADKSNRLFLQEWRHKGYVSENYSAISGSGDDVRLSSDRFHSWGALMGLMVFIESGVLPSPESPLIQVDQRWK